MNIIRHNLRVERSHTLIGEVKCICICLNGPRIEPILVHIVRNVGMLAYARARCWDYIRVRYFWKNYATKASTGRWPTRCDLIVSHRNRIWSLISLAWYKMQWNSPWDWRYRTSSQWKYIPCRVVSWNQPLFFWSTLLHILQQN